MKILISNDDGIYAPGINILKEVLSDVADIFTVAPLEERSTTGHTLTLDSPLRLVEISSNTYGCSGYPADCVLMGLGHIFKDNMPDLVISGINRGANLGQDVYYSGTVAAAREAVFRGVPAISISSVMDFLSTEVNEAYFYTAAHFVKDIVLNKMYQQLGARQLLNINVPDIAATQIQGVEMGKLGFRRYSADIQHRVDFRGRDYYWAGGKYQGHEKLEGTDCEIVSQDKISLSVLNLLNHSSDGIEEWAEMLKMLKNWVK